MQGNQIRSLVWEDPTCRKSVHHTCRVHTLQQEKPPRWEARTLQWRVAPTHYNQRKPTHSNEDPAQTKINKQSRTEEHRMENIRERAVKVRQLTWICVYISVSIIYIYIYIIYICIYIYIYIYTHTHTYTHTHLCVLVCNGKYIFFCRWWWEEMWKLSSYRAKWEVLY